MDRIIGVHETDDEDTYDFVNNKSLVKVQKYEKDYPGQKVVWAIKKRMDEAIEKLTDIYAMDVFAAHEVMSRKLLIELELEEVGHIPPHFFKKMLENVKENLLQCKRVTAEEVYAGEVRNMTRIAQKIEKHFDRKPNSQMAVAMVRANEVKQQLLGLNRPNSTLVVINNNNQVKEKGLPSSHEMQKMPIEELKRLLEEKKKLAIERKTIIDVGE